MTDLTRWMNLVAEHGLDGWLVADFRWNNPLFGRLLGLQSGTLTRRAFLWLPAAGKGEPLVLLSRVDGQTVSGLDCRTHLYGGFEEMATQLQSLLPRGAHIALEYSDGGKLPTVSRVDAGMVEFIRSFGVTVESSALLIATLEVWNDEQREVHERAARVVDESRRLALQRCGEWLRSGERVTEGRLTDLILTAFSEEGCADHAPAVALNANAADPHYSLSGEGAEITRDAVLLIDLSTKLRDREDAPYADSTWMAYTGIQPPQAVQHAFDVTRDARDAAIDAVNAASHDSEPIRGCDVDRITRSFMAENGMEAYLIHRTGHSLGTDHVHGMGTNLDDVEFPDDRPLLTSSGFTIEPGLYFPGRFGIRLEVSAMLMPDGVQVTTERQSELTLLA